MSGATPGLVVRGLTKRLGGRAVVDDVSFEVPAGRVVGLLGPNGAGKTTTFRLIVGLTAQDAGEIFLDGAALTGPLHERVRRGYLGPGRRALGRRASPPRHRALLGHPAAGVAAR